MTLLLLALTLRASGALLRCERLPLSILAWVLNCSAAALVTSAMGAWAPFWPVAAIALIGAGVEFKKQTVRWRPAGDCSMVLVTAMLSVPELALHITLPVALAMSLLGAFFDNFLNERPVKVKWGVGLLPLLVLAALLVSADSLRSHITGLAQIARLGGSLTLGITPFDPGERVVTSTGGVAWWKAPSGDGPFPGIVFFHGNHHRGAQQPAAEALRRAFLEGGFAVLAVDHPGFGESPLPDKSQGGVEVWDPLPHSLAAVEWMQRRSEVSTVNIAGHSMGTVEVLRLLAEKDLRVDGAVLLGSSLLPEPPREEYWFERFHRERHGWGADKLTLDEYRQIRDRYYDPAVLVAQLGPEHAPLLFVDFGMEGNDIVATRDELYKRIPGSKERWRVESASHYLTVLLTQSILVGDTRPTVWVGARLRSFLGSGAP